MTIETIHTLSPAFPVIERLGGKTVVSESLDLDKSTLSRWCQPKPAGSGGQIPIRHWGSLMLMARQCNVPLTLEELASIEV